MMAPSPSKSPTAAPPPASFILSVSDDTSPTTSSLPSTDAPKSQCSSLSDGESFECFGENDTPDHSNNGVDLVLAPQNVSLNNGSDEDRGSISRHAWARTSLRRTPVRTGRRQLGSNALASQLYRSSSFNSSGRSSNCDNTEDMYSDVSLEDVQDLNHKLELLQKQVTNLADTQNIVEDRTTRTKTEYAVLQARYHMLEEQLRESELRSDERLTEEQKRHRELLARVEREAQLQNENCQIKIKTIELECASLKDDVQRLRVQCDKQAADLHTTEEKLEIARENVQIAIQDLQEAHLSEKRLMAEKKQSDELMVELGKEIERLRLEKGPALPTTSPETLRLEELHTELEELRGKNKQLEETNDELQALVLTRGVEEGRNLLNGTSNSLAKELEEMDQNQDNVENAAASLASLSQLQVVYQEKEEENLRLKNYIDTILVNIVENYPQLLEVKTNY